MTQPCYPRLRPGSVRLKPDFIRKHHLGTITKQRAVARIEMNARFVEFGRSRALVQKGE